MARKLAALFLLFVLLRPGFAAAGQENTTFKPADPAPVTIGTLPKDAKTAWHGGPRAVPSGAKRCDVGTMPVVVGTTDASGGWTHEMQLDLDWRRANAMIAEGGSGKWARAEVTNLRGKAGVWCIKELENAKTTPPVTTPRVAITEKPERIVLSGDNTMKSLDVGGATFGATVSFGGECIGMDDALYAMDVAFSFRQGPWYFAELDASVSWDGEEGYRAIGWSVGVRPIGARFGAGDISFALRGGTSSHALVDHADEIRLGAGIAASLRPFWWSESPWLQELVELRVEVLGTQIYHEGDDFESADWSIVTRPQVRLKVTW